MKFKALGALAGLALLAACSSSTPTPTATAESSGAGATGAAPGSEQDLVANVGDRVFFDFNQSTLSSDADATLGRQSAWPNTRASTFWLPATAMSAAPRPITSPWARSALTRLATTWLPRVSPPPASRPFPMARTSRLLPAMTRLPGSRTATPSPRSRAPTPRAEQADFADLDRPGLPG